MENTTAKAYQNGCTAPGPRGVPGSRLNSSEAANLWTSYIESTTDQCMAGYLARWADDPQMLESVGYLRDLTAGHLKALEGIFRNEGYPLPAGFNDEDLDPDSPQLFTGDLALYYLEDLAATRLDGYVAALQNSSRSDVRLYFAGGLSSFSEFYHLVTLLLLEKGIYIRPPFMPSPEGVDFVFTASCPGNSRPLAPVEISCIFSAIKKNSLRKSLFEAFGQVAGSDQVRRYLARGRDMSRRHIKTLGSLLVESRQPLTMPWDPGVLDSFWSPFSERFILLGLVRPLNAAYAASLGKALPVVLRKGAGAGFARLLAESLKYNEEGLDLAARRGWLEYPMAGGRGNKKLLH